LISIEKIVVFSLNILFRFRRWAGPDSVCPCSAEMERGFRRFLFGGAGSGCRPDTAIARFPGWLTAPGRGRKAGLHFPFAATRAGNRFRFVSGGGDAIRSSGRGTGRSGTRSHPGIRPVLVRRKPLAKLDIFGYSL